MKKILICFLMAPFLFSCSNVLDTKPHDRISEETVWNDPNNVASFIFSTYAEVLADLAGGGVTSDNYTTNVISVKGGYYNKAYPVFSETINRNVDMGFNNWGEVRRCNLIISKVSASTMDDKTKEALIAEAKFLRALSYLPVARNIGRIVWIDTVLTPKDDLLLSSTKTPEESYQYIIQDLKDAIAGLPATSESGRANKYVAAAILSEVGLEAIAYENYPDAPGINSALLEMVIENAEMVINEGGYSLETDYGAMFNEVNPTSPEIILGLYKSDVNNICRATPMQYVLPNNSRQSEGTTIRAWWNYSPTYSFTKDYLTIDKNDPSKALPWNETSQYKAVMDESQSIPTDVIPRSPDEVSIRHGVIKPGSTETMWTLTNEGRDARWQASIITDSSTFAGNLYLTCVHGTSDRWRRVNGEDIPATTLITNLFFRKGCYTNLPMYFYNVPTNYHYVITRLGRVYLNLAEAYLLKGNVPDAVAALSKTRTVHGQLPPSTASTLADAWTDYKRERKVDLIAENDYYWSLLRWGRYGGAANHGNAPGGPIPELATIPEVMDISRDRTAYSILQGPFYGLNDQRNFDYSRRYLFPIAISYLDRNPKFGPQNVGW